MISYDSLNSLLPAAQTQIIRVFLDTVTPTQTYANQIKELGRLNTERHKDNTKYCPQFEQ
jgi:hypothetical protein